MNLEKFTDRAKGFLQAAQTVAIRMSHQRIAPEHVLKALLEDSEGMASGLIQRAGGTASIALAEVDKALGRFDATRHASGAIPTAELRLEMQRTMQSDAAVFRTEKTLAEGEVKMTAIAGKMGDLKVTDRSLVWNSDLMETLELTNRALGFLLKLSLKLCYPHDVTKRTNETCSGDYPPDQSGKCVGHVPTLLLRQHPRVLKGCEKGGNESPSKFVPTLGGLIYDAIWIHARKLRGL